MLRGCTNSADHPSRAIGLRRPHVDKSARDFKPSIEGEFGCSGLVFFLRQRASTNQFTGPFVPECLFRLMVIGVYLFVRDGFEEDTGVWNLLRSLSS